MPALPDIMNTLKPFLDFLEVLPGCDSDVDHDKRCRQTGYLCVSDPIAHPGNCDHPCRGDQIGREAVFG